MTRATGKRLLAAATVLASAGLAAGASAQDGGLKFGYINKMGDHPWFVSEVEGARQRAAELGAELMHQDVQFDADLTITAFDTMVADGVAGIAIVVPDLALGPVIAQKAQEAGIPIVAVDDDIYFEDGTPVPYVGIDAFNIGRQVGGELVKLYDASGWADDPDAVVRIASIEDQKIETCMKRNQGAEAAWMEAFPDWPAEDILNIPYDGTMVSAVDAMATVLTGNPEVTNWIFWACNDDGVLGGVRALENAGYDADAGFGIGIDGSRACDGIQSAEGFKGSMWFDSASHGATGIQVLYDHVVNGEPMPTEPIMMPAIYITRDNFEEYRDRLGCQ
jgi:L-arabinose transport system substrate-binding protein